MGDVTYRPTMSSTDALIWDIGRDPRLRSTVMVVWELDSTPTRARMGASVDRMIQAIPRLRQRVVEARPRPRWVDVDEIDLSHHVVRERLPGTADRRDAIAYAERWVAEPFDRSQPLWRLALLTGLPDGRAAVVIKVHHAIADGMGMLLMLAAFTDIEPSPQPQPPMADVIQMPDRRRGFGHLERIRRKLGRVRAAVRANPLGATRDAALTVASASRLVIPHRTPLSAHMTDRSGRLGLACHDAPLRDLKAASRAYDASINDVFVTVVSEAVRLYHERRGSACERLRLHIPVNSRTERTAGLAGNDFVPARIALEVVPASAHDDASRVAGVRGQLARLRGEPALHHISTVSTAVQRLGKPISRWVIGGMMRGVDVLASNVAGPPIPIYLAGARVDSFVAFGPPAGAAINITLVSYDDTVSFGVTADVAAVADRALLGECLDQAIAEFIGPARKRRHLLAV